MLNYYVDIHGEKSVELLYLTFASHWNSNMEG